MYELQRRQITKSGWKGRQHLKVTITVDDVWCILENCNVVAECRSKKAAQKIYWTLIGRKP